MSETKNPLEEWAPNSGALPSPEPEQPVLKIKRTQRLRTKPVATGEATKVSDSPSSSSVAAPQEALDFSGGSEALPSKRAVRQKVVDSTQAASATTFPTQTTSASGDNSPAPKRRQRTPRKKTSSASLEPATTPGTQTQTPIATSPTPDLQPPEHMEKQSSQQEAHAAADHAASDGADHAVCDASAGPETPAASEVSAVPAASPCDKDSAAGAGTSEDPQEISTREQHELRKARRRFRRWRERQRERRKASNGENSCLSGADSPGNCEGQNDAMRSEVSEPEQTNSNGFPEDQEPVFAEGVLEISGKGFGFLRERSRNYLAADTDIFVTPEVIRKYGLRDGVFIRGQLRKGSRGPQLFKLTEYEGRDPNTARSLPVFEELTVLNPLEWIRLETTPERYTTRVIDLIAPIGKGQRGLLVAPPRTGKTTLLQHIAEAVQKNHPSMKLIVLLVDERPEEVTELKRCLPGAELFASSNDCELKSHTHIAQLAVERARRLVELGEDVFLVMDSLTRIGRAFNNVQSGGGRTMSGGVDTRALEIPRKLFASARNTEEAGSLTIIATALIETGSRMDELIFLEFKGTGNMELVLDRKISDLRIYPAVDIFQSGTRREELLLPADCLQKINVIRRGLAGHKPQEAIERLLFFLRKYPTNEEMLRNIPVS
jgi:transcription termination factor Rho